MEELFDESFLRFLAKSAVASHDYKQWARTQSGGSIDKNIQLSIREW